MEFPWNIAAFVLLACAGLSFIFALAESSMFSLGLWRAKALRERDPVRGSRLVKLLEQPNDLLASIVLSNGLANAFLIAIGLQVAQQGGLPTLATGTGLILLVLLFCEVTPKALAVRTPDFWALRLARPMVWNQSLTRPFRKIAQWIVTGILERLTPKSIRQAGKTSDEEYSDLVELAAQQGTLGSVEKEIILQILSLDRRMARDVMRPRAQMVTLPDDLDLAAMAEAVRRSRHHRIPLYDENPDNIVGILNTRTLGLQTEPDLSEAIEFPSFVPETMNLLKLFEALQRQGRGMAIVLDEFGGTAGLVTLQDILEAVIGRIRGEGESEGFVMEKLDEGRWRVSGSMRLDDFRRQHPELGDDPDVDTLGGLLTKLAEVVPAEGQVFLHRGLRMTVKVADERRVREVLVEQVGVKGGRG